MSSIGADGLTGRDGPPPISSVGASGYSNGGGGVRVSISNGYWPDWLRITASNERVDGAFVVRLLGGNTNDGDADRYEEAAELYRRAIEVARKLEQTIANPDWWHAEDFEPRAHVVGQPDYVLALYLALKGMTFEYGRDVDDDQDAEMPDTRVVGLNTLRQMAVEQIAGGQR